jgi:hypothetical protein
MSLPYQVIFVQHLVGATAGGFMGVFHYFRAKGGNQLFHQAAVITGHL